MKELREKLHEAIDEYGLTDKRTVAISQELDKVVCQAQKLIAKEGLDYIEAVEKAKRYLQDGMSASEASKKSAQETGYKKGDIYRLLNIK